MEQNICDEGIEGCRTTKIYCHPGCPAGRRMLPKNRVTFASREEARIKGYRPCKRCRPDEQDGGKVFCPNKNSLGR
jgi:methylphosphotriester-DNA--protein-cysteine methyltransferase